MYSGTVGYAAENEGFFAQAARAERAEEAFFGRVAKNHSLYRQTFSQGKMPGGIDTFRAAMIKYIEINRKEKGDGIMQAKMMRAKQKSCFAIVFAVAPVSLFCVD